MRTGTRKMSPSRRLWASPKRIAKPEIIANAYESPMRMALLALTPLPCSRDSGERGWGEGGVLGPVAQTTEFDAFS
jgi:hypothetical protein